MSGVPIPILALFIFLGLVALGLLGFIITILVCYVRDIKQRADVEDVEQREPKYRLSNPKRWH